MAFFIYMYSQLETFQARSQLNFVTGSNSLMIQRMRQLGTCFPFSQMCWFFLKHL